MDSIRLPVRFHRVFPAEAPLGDASRVIDLDPARLALLLVDVYHKAEKPEGANLVPAAWDEAWWKIVRNALAPTIVAVRRAGIPVVYAMNSAPRIELACSPFGRVHAQSRGFDLQDHFCEAGVDPLEYARGDSIQLHIPEPIAPQPGDYYLRKHVYSGFFETRLHSLLTNLGVTHLLCAGFAANACLMFTMGDAVFRGYEVVLLRDCTLAAEEPVDAEFPETGRSIRWTESFLGSSALSEDLVLALRSTQAVGSGAGAI